MTGVRLVRAGKLAVGDTAPASYVWDDGDCSDEQLPGASAIMVGWEGVASAVAQLEPYILSCAGDPYQIVLLESSTALDGADDFEIVMVDAVVMEVIADVRLAEDDGASAACVPLQAKGPAARP